MDAALQNTPSLRLLRIKEVTFLTGLPKSSLYELMGRKLFPKSVSLPGGKSVAWLSAEVEEWIADRVRERDCHTPACEADPSLSYAPKAALTVV